MADMSRPSDASSGGSPSGAASGRWWAAFPGEQPTGPFDLGTLRAMYASGHLSSEMMLCPEEGGEWRQVPDLLGAPPVPPVQPGLTMTPRADPRWQDQSLVLPILATIFCCLVGGIISIVYTSQANTKGAMGDLAGAQRDMKTVRTWLLISVLTPVLALAAYVLLWVILMLIGIGIAGATGRGPVPAGGP